MTENYLLEVKNVSKSFGVVKALNRIDFNVRPNEIHALCGENGAGKSTLMNILSGVYPYGSYGGEVYYDGELCKFRNVRESEKKNIAIIHQHLALFPALSIAENMLIVYANSSFMAAVSSIIVTARLNAASTSAGTNFELDAIAACYIGGCAAGGGEGTIMGVLIGALVMGILNNGMSIMGIGADFQKVVKGAILLLAVTYDVYSKQSKSNG